MHIIWNKVTRLSQLVAIILFVGVFFLGMYLGERTERLKIMRELDQSDYFLMKR